MAWRLAVTISGIIIPISLLYAYYRYKCKYSKRETIPYITTSESRGSQSGSAKQLLWRVYTNFKAITPIAGIYLDTITPAVVLLDLELIKRVLIDDFSNFCERLNDQSYASDFLHTLNNKEWQMTRRKLTPCFWSAQMDLIFPSVTKVAKETVNQEMEEILENNNKIDLQIFCTNYAANAFLSCVFGTELNPNKANESAKALRLCINELLMNEYQTRFSHIDSLMMSNLSWAHCTTHAGGRTTISSEKFNADVQTILEERLARKIKGTDILQIFIDLFTAAASDDANASESASRAKILITQILDTLLTGFANSAKVLTHCLYELARNKEIQQKLRSDIERILEMYENEFGYEAMGHMHYLDQVVAETLRKYPNSEVLIRHSLKDYRVPSTPYTIERDTCVLVPVHAIHHDSAIYTEPEKFDPSRFDAAEVMARHACAYLSFDDGPRNCLGKRLSKMLIKVAVVMILRSYKIERENESAKELSTEVEEEEDLVAPNKLHVRIQKI